MDPERYSEQLKWKQNVIEKAEHKKQEEIEALNDLSFQPIFESKDNSEIKKISGLAAELTNKSGGAHVERQMKARKEKQLKTDKLTWKANRPKISPNNPSVGNNIRDKYLTYSGSPSKGVEESTSFDTDDVLEDERNKELTYEESLVETLEKERKEWHTERVNLIHCIYLQQMELAERAVAAQDKAAKIAKEFGEAITIFEQRLDTIESNVEREIKAVKDIAENLLRAITTSNALASSGELHEKLSSTRTL